MSKWKITGILLVMLTATSYGSVASAQVRTPFPTMPATQPVPLPEKATQTPPQPGPTRHKMPLPPAQAPIPDVIRYDAAMLIHLRGQLVGAMRGEDAVSFKFENGVLTQETIAGQDTVRGDYKYDRHGRLDRVEYSDGPTIQAHYGSQNELQSLTSDNGRTIRFSYRDGIGDGSSVAPASKHFQGALALLRMEKLPIVLITPLEQLLRNDSTGLEYSQHKTPTITINAPRLPDNEASPIDFIPIGGSGGGGGGGGGKKGSGGSGPPSLGEVLDAGQRVYLTVLCRRGCGRSFEWINNGCGGGPTFRDQMQCRAKAVFFRDRCNLACDMGDFTQDWQQNSPPIDFFPWQSGQPPT